jgi:hypothetical protein
MMVSSRYSYSEAQEIAKEFVRENSAGTYLEINENYFTSPFGSDYVEARIYEHEVK